MAAPLGYKDFTTGEVLTANDVDGYLMQGIWVFANATARDAAVTSPQEGNACYLKDTDVIMVYTGSTWATQSASNPISANIVDAKGDLIAATAADTVSRLAVGANNTVLTADSSTATGLKWAAAAGGGKVLQVVSVAYSTETLTASTTFADSGLTASITPTSATSKILVLVCQNIYCQLTSGGTSAGGGVRLVRGSTSIFNDTADYQTSYIGDFSSINVNNVSYTNIMYMDSPATTSATTYKTQQRAYSTANGGRIRSQIGNTTTSTITLLEIGA
jgi:hypothetical protein